MFKPENVKRVKGQVFFCLHLNIAYKRPEPEGMSLWNGIPVCISNYIHYKVWDEIAYPLPNFNGATVEVWEWIGNFMCLLSHAGIKVSKRGRNMWSGIPWSISTQLWLFSLRLQADSTSFVLCCMSRKIQNMDVELFYVELATQRQKKIKQFPIISI